MLTLQIRKKWLWMILSGKRGVTKKGCKNNESNLKKAINPAAQWRGWVNKAQGAHFERLIEQSCRYYQGTGTAVIEKTTEPFHITRNLGDGKFQGDFAKAAQPDFKGVL